MKYIYLHGFASSPLSTKAKFFAAKLQSHNCEIDVLDLNGDDFSRLKVSDIISSLQKQYTTTEELTIIGSSMGGLIALNLAESMSNVKKLVLLAPAIKINSLWHKIVGDIGMKYWQEKGQLPIYHYGEKREINLHYDFILDLMKNVRDNGFNHKVDTLIVHGINDGTIPARNSQEYSLGKDYVKLHIINSDHSLEDSLSHIWVLSKDFLKIR